MDMKFDSDIPVTFRLVEGNGPVHIAAEHVVGRFKLVFHDAAATPTPAQTPTRQTRLQSYVRHTLFPREDPREEIACVGRKIL